MGFQLKSPTPGVFQSQFPTPMGDGDGDPMGPPWGLGVGGKPYAPGTHRFVQLKMTDSISTLTLIILNNFKLLLFNFYSRSILNQGIQKCTKETATDDVMFQRSIKNVPSKIQPKIDTGLRRTNTKIQVCTLRN